MADFLSSQSALLANGDRVSLVEASNALETLRYFMDAQLEGSKVLFLIREACLGKPIIDEQRQALIKEKVMNHDGSIDPTMKSVVLAAVRGEDRTLWIESPFTDSIDRSICEFLKARDLLSLAISPEDYNSLFATKDEPRKHDTLIRAALAIDPPSDDDADIPPMPEEMRTAGFARRCRPSSTDKRGEG